jgi:hypothetical protein
MGIPAGSRLAIGAGITSIANWTAAAMAAFSAIPDPIRQTGAAAACAFIGGEMRSGVAFGKAFGLASGLTACLLLALILAGCMAPSGSQQVRGTTPENFHSLMPPQSLLRDDTVEAATHDRGVSRLAYVGVWAVNGESCAMMDQTAFDGYAVITPGGLRQSGSACTFEPGVSGQSVQRFEANCKVGRKTKKRSILVAMQNSQTMRLSFGDVAPARNYVRCHLPR